MKLQQELGAALIVEGQALSQSHIKNTLIQMGFKDIDSVDRGYLATRAISNKYYSLVLCSMELKKGADGLQLFEQLVHQHILRPSTAFVFLSSEQEIGESRAVIELQPDDFILKPFTSKELEQRLSKCLQTKLWLHDVYLDIDKKRFEQANDKLNEHINNNNDVKWIPTLMKLKGELFQHMEQWSAGEKYYLRVCQIHPQAWAKLGYVHCLLKQGKVEQGKQQLQLLLKENNKQVSVLSLLADIYGQQHKFEQQANYLKQAIELSPRNIPRLNQYAQLARLMKDYDAQYHTYNHIVREADHSIFDNPDLHLNAVRSAIDFGLTCFNEEEVSRAANNGQQMLTGLKKRFPGVLLSNQVTIAQARIHNLKKEPEKGKALLQNCVEQIDNDCYYLDDLEDGIDQAKALNELGFHKHAQTMFELIDKQLEQKPSPMLEEYLQDYQQLTRLTNKSPKELNNRGVNQFKRGATRSAVAEFELAFKIMPKNPTIALNLFQVLTQGNELPQLHTAKEKLIEQCQSILENAKLTDEQKHRYQKLIAG